MAKKIKKLEEKYCIHRNLMHIGGLFGCGDCGAGDSEIRSKVKMKPRHPDPVIKKINEIVDALNNASFGNGASYKA